MQSDREILLDVTSIGKVVKVVFEIPGINEDIIMDIYDEDAEVKTINNSKNI